MPWKIVQPLIIKRSKPAQLTHAAFATHSHCTGPCGFAFCPSFSCSGHKFIYCTGRPQKRTLWRFWCFSHISRSQVASTATQLNSTEKGITYTTLPCSETELKVKVNKKGFVFSLFGRNKKSLKCQLCNSWTTAVTSCWPCILKRENIFTW